MDVADWTAALDLEGARLVDAAARTSLDAPVPSCPAWRLRDLLRHVGYVHRWAAGYVSEGRTEMSDEPGELEVLRGGPGDDRLVAWVAEGLGTLVGALRAAAPHVDCWTFLPAPSPLAFWARRQAHETAVHRVDTELAGDAPVTPFAPLFAVDGLDELLLGFAARRRKPLEDRTRSLAFYAVDAGAGWSVMGGAQRGGAAAVRVETARIVTATEPATGGDVAGEPGPADEGRWALGPTQTTVVGPASDLYLLLWNRRGLDGLEVVGDPATFAWWHDAVRVTWS